AARRQHDERITPLERRAHRLFLQRPQLGEPESAPHLVAEPLERRIDGGGAPRRRVVRARTARGSVEAELEGGGGVHGAGAIGPRAAPRSRRVHVHPPPRPTHAAVVTRGWDVSAAARPKKRAGSPCRRSRSFELPRRSPFSAWRP